MVDAPAWRLVKALDTLVSDDGNTVTIDGYPEVPPLSEQDKAMIAAAVARTSEATARKQLRVQHWIDDLSRHQANDRLVSPATVRTDGPRGGHTGTGSKTGPTHRRDAKNEHQQATG